MVEVNDEIDNKSELIKQTEDFFRLFEHDLTQEAKNIIWRFLNLVKTSYPNSDNKQQWNALMLNLQTVIYDFPNDLSIKSELKLTAMLRNAEELQNQENHRRIFRENQTVLDNKSASS